jgi:outer membrane receptor for ferrienterochelin and colicin
MPFVSIEPHWIVSDQLNLKKNATYADDEEDTSEYGCGHRMQHDEKWASHCSPESKTHEEMGNTLLCDCGGIS